MTIEQKKLIEQYKVITGVQILEEGKSIYRMKKMANGKQVKQKMSWSEVQNRISLGQTQKPKSSIHCIDKVIEKNIDNFIDTKRILANADKKIRKEYKNAGCSITVEDYEKLSLVAKRHSTTVSALIKSFIDSVIK